MEFSNFTWDVAKKSIRLYCLEMLKGLLTFLPQYGLCMLAKKKGKEGAGRRKLRQEEGKGEERRETQTYLF